MAGRRSLVVLLLASAVAVAACGDDLSPPAPVADSALAAARARVDAIGIAVDRWAEAGSIAEAHAAAEEASNLVAGPASPSAGDLDRDGETLGLAEEGLLPGVDGEPGLAGEIPGDCADADVLGGPWDDPAARWEVARAAIDAWSPTNNTFPGLPSHPQRIVGWAALTQRSDSLEDAREYAGHAQLHVEVTADALAAC